MQEYPDGWYQVTNKRNQPVVYRVTGGRIIIGASTYHMSELAREGNGIDRVEVCDIEALAKQQADRARLVAQAEELQARVTELESAIVIDRGVFNRLCTLQAIMEHPTAMPSAEEFNEYTGLLELVFHRHDKEAADNV